MQPTTPYTSQSKADHPHMQGTYTCLWLAVCSAGASALAKARGSGVLWVAATARAMVEKSGSEMGPALGAPTVRVMEGTMACAS
jgi:hypothetical protein